MRTLSILACATLLTSTACAPVQEQTPFQFILEGCLETPDASCISVYAEGEHGYENLRYVRGRIVRVSRAIGLSVDIKDRDGEIRRVRGDTITLVRYYTEQGREIVIS